ncbi:hypothetical protein ABPG77_002997 [Micractinium sp. CCAP 211/92]
MCGAASRSLAASAAAAVLAAALLLAMSGAAAQPLFSPEGPSHVPVENDAEAYLFQQVLTGITEASAAIVEGRNVSADRVAAAAAVKAPDATPDQLARMVGRVMAAASLQTEALSALGDPSTFWYQDGGRHALYRLPRGQPARGVCVFVGGCKHDAEAWFYRSEKCPYCLGLPEEVAHTKQCLARGYAVLALTPKDRVWSSRCFSSSGDPALSDHPDTKWALQTFTAKLGLRGKPIYMFGVSSGASFAVKFPATMAIQGLVSEVNQPWEYRWGVTNGKGKLLVPFPPTAYVWMERDAQTKRQIEKAVTLLRNNGVRADSIYSPPRPVTKAYLSSRSMLITPVQSALIQKALRRLYLLDANGFVRYDPRMRTLWANQLLHALPWLATNKAYLNLVQDQSQIWEELNVAWSMHEGVADYVRPALMWLESRGKANLNALVQRYSLNGTLSCLTERVEGCP